jgi:hypothetical protein
VSEVDEFQAKAKVLKELLIKRISEEGPQNISKHHNEIFRQCLGLAEVSLKALREHIKRMRTMAEEIEAKAKEWKDNVLRALALSLEALYQELEFLIEEIKFERALTLALLIETYIPLQYEVLGLKRDLEQLLEFPREVLKEFEKWLKEQEELRKRVEKYVI